MKNTFSMTRKTTPPANAFSRVMGCILRQGANTTDAPSGNDLSGKTVLVTGGNSGIGAALVTRLRATGARVIAASRSAKGPDTLSFDLADLNSVQQAAAFLADTKIDVFCANAGISPKGKHTDETVLEPAFATNCLGHHALITRLIAQGSLAKKAKVIFTTGDIYCLASDCSADFSGSSLQAYSRSKLGNIWQAFELARRHPELIGIAVHPGVVATALEGRTTGFVGALKRAIMISPDAGAQAALIATTQELPTGSYYHNTRGLVDLRPNDPALNTAQAASFWDLLDIYSQRTPT